MELAKWKDEALQSIRRELANDRYWRAKLVRSDVRVHLAVFVEPWLTWLLDGTKTIESRFSVRRGVPYQKVASGDILLLKASSGPVLGISDVGKTWYFDLEETPVEVVQRRYGTAIGADDDFWESVRTTRYVTLLEVREPRAIGPLSCPKKDRRGWVVFDARSGVCVGRRLR